MFFNYHTKFSLLTLILISKYSKHGLVEKFPKLLISVKILYSDSYRNVSYSSPDSGWEKAVVILSGTVGRNRNQQISSQITALWKPKQKLIKMLERIYNIIQYLLFVFIWSSLISFTP